MSELLILLARAFDTKGYPDDKDPDNWRKINGAPVHLDNNGNIDGGAGGKFAGKQWNSTNTRTILHITLSPQSQKVTYKKRGQRYPNARLR